MSIGFKNDILENQQLISKCQKIMTITLLKLIMRIQKVIKLQQKNKYNINDN